MAQRQISEWSSVYRAKRSILSQTERNETLYFSGIHSMFCCQKRLIGQGVKGQRSSDMIKIYQKKFLFEQLGFLRWFKAYYKYIQFYFKIMKIKISCSYGYKHNCQTTLNLSCVFSNYFLIQYLLVIVGYFSQNYHNAKNTLSYHESTPVPIVAS